MDHLSINRQRCYALCETSYYELGLLHTAASGLGFIHKSRMKQRPIASGSKAANDVLMGAAAQSGVPASPSGSMTN